MRRRDFIIASISSLFVPAVSAADPFDQIGRPPVDFDQIGQGSAKRKVQMFSPSWCSGCQQLERSMVGKDDYDVEWVHDEKQFPEWVLSVVSNGGMYPIAYWQASPTVWRRLLGVASYEVLKAEVEACAKNPTHNTAKVPPKQVSRSGLFYGTYGSTYDWPGDLRNHLATTHGLDYGAVSSWSDGQCIAWHDQWHIAHQRRGIFGFRRG